VGALRQRCVLIEFRLLGSLELRGEDGKNVLSVLAQPKRTAQRALGLVCTDESQVRSFIRALAEAGDRSAAVRFYDKFAGKLAQELELEPGVETRTVAEAIRIETPLSHRPATELLRVP